MADEDFQQLIIDTGINEVEGTALHIPGLTMSGETMQMMINQGGDVHARDKYGRTPMHLQHDPDVLEVLINHGGDVNATDTKGCTPLHCNDSEACISLLISRGANVNAQDINGQTPLHNRFLEFGAVCQLLIAGARVNAPDKWGRTPLHTHTKEDNVRLLLRNGALVNQTDTEGYTPLHNPYLEYGAMMALLEKGANVNAQNSKGERPLITLFQAMFPDKDDGARLKTIALVAAGSSTEGAEECLLQRWKVNTRWRRGMLRALKQ